MAGRASLLDILRITKQSLGRVLKDLIDKGYVFQKEGDSDRRQRLLYLTEKGEALRRKLMAPQMARIRRALQQSGKARRAPATFSISGEPREPRQRVGPIRQSRQPRQGPMWMTGLILVVDDDRASANCSNPAWRRTASGTIAN
jgi:DNA-binding MarR family transcriptional regulator